jgi:hypothetical protein
MNLNFIIKAVCALALLVGAPFGIYKEDMDDWPSRGLVTS